MPLGSDTATPLGPLTAAAVLRSAREQLNNDIATLLEAFTADTGLLVSGIELRAQPQYLVPFNGTLSLSSANIDPTRPYHYTVSSVVDF
jgi:hypothetical protein